MLVHELVHSGLGDGHSLAVSVVNDLLALTLALSARGFDDLIGLGLGGGALALGKRGGFLSSALTLGGQLGVVGICNGRSVGGFYIGVVLFT